MKRNRIGTEKYRYFTGIRNTDSVSGLNVSLEEPHMLARQQANYTRKQIAWRNIRDELSSFHGETVSYPWARRDSCALLLEDTRGIYIIIVFNSPIPLDFRGGNSHGTKAGNGYCLAVWQFPNSGSSIFTIL